MSDAAGEAARKVAEEFVAKAYDSLEPVVVWIDGLATLIAAHTEAMMKQHHCGGCNGSDR